MQTQILLIVLALLFLWATTSTPIWVEEEKNPAKSEDEFELAWVSEADQAEG